jgi:signal transduction histidine kinase
MAHRGTLVRVVANLLSNAVKFVEPGKAPMVRVSTEPRGGRVRLWVEDNGIGLKPEHRERIFRVFERLHGVEKYPGTGIGLAIVRKGMERMGGAAGVESGPGNGSRFWVELDRAGGG